jgi:hypothetical protein
MSAVGKNAKTNLLKHFLYQKNVFCVVSCLHCEETPTFASPRPAWVILRCKCLYLQAFCSIPTVSFFAVIMSVFQPQHLGNTLKSLRSGNELRRLNCTLTKVYPMKTTRKMSIKSAVPLAALLLAGHLHAQNVNMTYNGTYNADTGFNAYLNGSQIINGNDLIGVYQFNINSISPDNLTISTPFWTTCLSPAGNLNSGVADNYTLQTFAQAQPGINPSAWVSPAGSPLAGIQNANYLFSQQAGTFEAGGTLGGLYTGSSSDQAAAMTLAMWTALFNSTSYGTAANGTSAAGSGFFVDLSGNANLLNDYNLNLSALQAYGGTPYANGYVLTPSPDEFADAGQAMILLGSTIPNGGFQPVPEPTTFLAGALLLLPFGATVLRIVRRRQGV